MTAADLLLGGGVASALAPRVRRGGAIKLAFSGVSSSDKLDPATTTTYLGMATCAMIYDGLLSADYQWNLTPMLAEDWTVNKAATRWTFKLRRGVKFHNGQPFTSADVKYSILRILNPKTGAEGFGTVSGILTPGGVHTPDPHTIIFELKKPDAFFATKLAGFGFRIVQNGQTNFLKGSHGTGPFVNAGFTGGQSFHFTRNPDYWQHGVPYLDTVTGVDITNPATKVQSVISGDADLIDPPDWSQLPQLRAASGVTLWPTPATTNVAIDIDSSAKPFSDPNVSHALKMLINRHTVAKLIAPGIATVSADSLVPPSDPYYPKDLKPFAYDPEQAKSMLAKAGLGSGFAIKLVTTDTIPGLSQLATLTQQMWQQGGLQASVDSLSADQWNNEFLKVPVFFDAYARQHPITMATSFMLSTSSVNTTQLKDHKIDALIYQVEKTVSRKGQIEIFGEILRRYNNIAAEIVPIWVNQPFAASKKLLGLKFTPSDLVDLRHAYLRA